MNANHAEWLEGARQPSPEYKAALEEMLANARLLRDLATDQIGKVCGAIEALRSAANCERIATGLLMDNVAKEDRPWPTVVTLCGAVPVDPLAQIGDDAE